MNQFFQELRTGFEIGKLPKMLLKVHSVAYRFLIILLLTALKEGSVVTDFVANWF